MQSIHLKNKSYSVDTLPSEPRLLVQLLELCHDDQANFDMFASAIRKDLGLTAKIIQVANSPAYRQWNKIIDIRRMLIVLGMTNIRKIVTTCAIQQFFSKFTRSFSKNVQHVWLRSLVCANLAERLARLTGHEKPGEAFLAGLLHQIGMLLLLLNREAEYLPLLNRYYQETENFTALEQNRLQLDHCELGAALVDSWGLDSFIADAIQFQHASAEDLSSSPLLLKIMAVASPLSSKNSARENPAYLQKAGQLFNMTEDIILDCLDIAVEKSKQMITDLGFSAGFYLEKNEGELFDETRHQKVSDDLGERVRDIALGGTVGGGEDDLLTFAKNVRSTFSTLFNLDQLLVLRIAEAGRPRLTPINDLNVGQLEEIAFNLDDPHSLLVKAFLNSTFKTSIDESCAIADKQLIRLLGGDTLAILPLSHKGDKQGVVVVGLKRTDWPRLQDKVPLFNLLSREIGAGLAQLSKQQDRPEGMTMVDFRKVAHEVSNPLTIINNYLYILGKKIDSNHPAQEELKFISEEIERAGQILLHAKDPAAKRAGQGNRLDVNQLINEIDTLLKGSLYKTHKIESSLSLDRALPTIDCAKDKLKQVLLNILKNAVEAFENSGKIEITTRDNIYQNGRRYIEIAIKDNGPGIPPEILENLFQPVVSTKENHSGLGLSIVNQLIGELSGNISCYSRRDEGTEFKILIPRTTENSGNQTN